MDMQQYIGANTDENLEDDDFFDDEDQGQAEEPIQKLDDIAQKNIEAKKQENLEHIGLGANKHYNKKKVEKPLRFDGPTKTEFIRGSKFGGRRDNKPRFQPRPKHYTIADVPSNPPFVVKVKNISFASTKDDIAQFFSDCSPTDIMLPPASEYENRPHKGFAKITLSNPNDMLKALSKDAMLLQDRPIQLYPEEQRFGGRSNRYDSYGSAPEEDMEADIVENWRSGVKKPTGRKDRFGSKPSPKSSYSSGGGSYSSGGGSYSSGPSTSGFSRSELFGTKKPKRSQRREFQSNQHRHHHNSGSRWGGAPSTEDTTPIERGSKFKQKKKEQELRNLLKAETTNTSKKTVEKENGFENAFSALDDEHDF